MTFPAAAAAYNFFQWKVFWFPLEETLSCINCFLLCSIVLLIRLFGEVFPCFSASSFLEDMCIQHSTVACTSILRKSFLINWLRLALWCQAFEQIFMALCTSCAENECNMPDKRLGRCNVLLWHLFNIYVASLYSTHSIRWLSELWIAPNIFGTFSHLFLHTSHLVQLLYVTTYAWKY